MTQRGFSILYKKATTQTDNTLITILGKPSLNESWQDHVVSIITSVLLQHIPNAHRLSIVNNEYPLIKTLAQIGFLVASQSGSLQNITLFDINKHLESRAKKENKDALELAFTHFNPNLYKGSAELYDNAKQAIMQGNTPIFDFGKEYAKPTIKMLQESAEDDLWQLLHTKSKHQYCIYKNAIIAESNSALFLESEFNNLVLIDTSHTDDDYLANWKYLDINEYIPAFEVIASNTDSRYGEATLQRLQEVVADVLVPNTLAELTK